LRLETLRVLLAAYLAVWEPLSVASLAAASVSSIGFRGVAGAIELAWGCAVAALSIGGAWSVWGRAIGAPTLARAAIVAVAARDLQALYWTRLPSNVVPGTRPALTAVVVAVGGLAWLAATRLGPRD
jgi:hypothetical protein